MNLRIDMLHILSGEALRQALGETAESLVSLNRVWMRAKGTIGPSDVGFFRYGETTEWLDLFACLERGYADCKSIVPWRVAELRESGIDARVRVILETDGSWHLDVQLPDGKTEDPCVGLGMGRRDDGMTG